jgi:hypothetical protein
MTVIEMAIASILLGVIFIMTLRGTALIDSMKGWIMVHEFPQFQTRVLSYQQTYGFLPGDDPQGANRFDLPNATFKIGGVMANQTGDGTLDGELSDVRSPNAEIFMAWRQLRAAGYLEGDVALAGLSAAPENPFGGIYGFDRGNLGQTGGSICATRVPGRAAEFIDKHLDDGVINKGHVVATSRYDPVEAHNHFDAPDSAPYDYAKQYIICVPLLP